VGTPTARILLVHGIAEYSGRYEIVGELLARAGFEVHCPDLFGFGESGGRMNG
jgi:alpha-beta hydrolase superfamily lysophospholipase